MTAADSLTKIVLDENEIPTHWYNVIPELPRPPAPVLQPGTGQPVGQADLAPLFPMALIGQEVSQDRTVQIPDEVRDVYRLWRPTPLFRAHRLERALDTTAHIYYKLLRARKASAKLGTGPIPLENPFSAQEPVSL